MAFAADFAAAVFSGGGARRNVVESLGECARADHVEPEATLLGTDTVEEAADPSAVPPLSGTTSFAATTVDTAMVGTVAAPSEIAPVVAVGIEKTEPAATALPMIREEPSGKAFGPARISVPDDTTVPPTYEFVPERVTTPEPLTVMP